MSDEPTPAEPPRRRVWPWIALLLWAGCLTASLLDVGGLGEAFAVPVMLGLLVGLIALWRWEQARKRAGRVTHGEELTKELLTGSPIGFLLALWRGPER